MMSREATPGRAGFEADGLQPEKVATQQFVDFFAELTKAERAGNSPAHLDNPTEGANALPEDDRKAELLRDSDEELFGNVSGPVGPIITEEARTRAGEELDAVQSNQGPRMATPEERNAFVSYSEHNLIYESDYLEGQNRLLYPTQPGEQPALISIRDIIQKYVLGEDLISDDKKPQEIQDRTLLERSLLARLLVDSEVPFNQVQERLNKFSKEDRDGIEAALINIITDEIRGTESSINLPDDTEVRFVRNPAWINELKANYPQLRDQRRSGLLRRGLDRLVNRKHSEVMNAEPGEKAGKGREPLRPLKLKFNPLKPLGGPDLIGKRFRRPTLEELKQVAIVGWRNWKNNLDPRGKDKAWVLGVALGGAEGLAVMAIGPIPGKGLVKAGINAAAMQGFWAASRWGKMRGEYKIRNRFYGDELEERLKDYEEKYARGSQKMKNFFAGVSAGAVYGSALGLGLEMAKVFPLGIHEAPIGTAGAPVEGAVDQAPDSGAQDTGVTGGDQAPSGDLTSGSEAGQVPPDVITPDTVPDAVPPEPTTQISPNITPELPKAVSAQPAVSAVPPMPETINLPKGSNPWTEVKGYLHDSLDRDPSGPEIQEAVNKVLAENNIADAHAVQPGDLKIHEVNEYIHQLKGEQSLPAVTEQVTNIKAAEVGKVLSSAQDEAVKKALEQSHFTLADVDQAAVDKAHQAVQNALEIKANAVYDAAGSSAEAGQKAFESWLATDAAHSQLAETAQNAFVEQAREANIFTHQVSTALEATPNLYADQAIAHGTNVGQMLHDAGYQVTWTGADAEMLGAHIAANHDMLAKMTHDMALNHNIPENPFSVGMTEIYDLVTKAQNGDQSALRRLFEALRYIPEGQKLRILNKAGIDIALAALRK